MSPDAAPPRVRPYAITGGRTRPRGAGLPIESLVTRTAAGGARLTSLGAEQRRIVELSDRPASVAEVAARAGVHLGVAAVLIGDLEADGLVSVHRPAHDGEGPAIALLEKVLHGLRAL